MYKELKRKGFTFVRSGKGSHDIYSNGEYQIVVPTNPCDRVIRCIIQATNKKGPFYRAQQVHKVKDGNENTK